ncbi:MAG: efflux RND transporter permease subunit [Verrucomicrobiales bacterium]|jgi:multidrug efflux pump|nr:efflux RND transporter permease subunit [Verrucomicrobiales bacterium]
MKLARFFLDRPVFAWVIAILIMLAGLLAIKTLPVAQYPAIAPTAINIDVMYPGANAQTVQDTVVQVIEQKMNGIDNLEYLSSASQADGSMSISLTFKQGTDPDIAQVQVQNKLQLAIPLLPLEVQQQGIRVTKAVKNFLLVVGLISPNGTWSQYDLTDYLVSNVQDPVSRTAGVGDFTVFGSQYSMRIWLDPAKLLNYQLTVSDVTAAVRAQNVQVSAGELGGAPSVRGQRLNATIIGPTRLQSQEEFGAILLRVNSDGAQVRLRDVATFELGPETYAINARYNGQPSAGLGIKLATGANALAARDAVLKTMESLKPYFPEDMTYILPYDTTPFVRLSIEEVIETLIEAVVLVFLVMYLFLQNIRATLIPTIAIPVVLLGTFAVLAACGFSINTLTMFAMVLAIGLLVDDAIVVVENVERVMSEEGLSPLEATRKSMGQITGALVAIALVLSAVFVPMAFFGGSTGVIYRQFSITIVSAMLLSVVVAVILTPVLCAKLLKPIPKGGHVGATRGPIKWFNVGFNRSNELYRKGVTWTLRRVIRCVVIYLAIVGVTGWLFLRIPASFLPEEDQGYVVAMAQLPPGSTMEQTIAVSDAMREYILKEEGDAVKSVFNIVGFSFAGRGQNSAMAFIDLKDWHLRNKPELKAQAVAARAMKNLARLRQAQIYVTTPPAVMELGNATGFDFELQDRAGLGHARLLAARNQLLGLAAASDQLVAVRPNGMEDAAQYQLTIDREKASVLGVPLPAAHETLSVAWGSAYINDFIDRGRVKKVFMQGTASARMMPDDLGKWYVRNTVGDMVQFSSFTNAAWVQGPQKLERYNGVPAFEILGQAIPGRSSGEAMKIMEQLASQLPRGVGFEWTGLSFEERLAGAQAPALYAISVLIVFLCLAALYESWSVPLSVMLVVPLGILGTVSATYFRGLNNDVYFQVGLLTTVGLAAKNAILIVEFAKDFFDHGMTLTEAAASAAFQRLRPILMTSLAFILGVLPLAVTQDAGSGAQNAIGTGVIGGMLTATFLAIFFVPLFFVLMLKLFRVKPRHAAETTPSAEVKS